MVPSFVSLDSISCYLLALCIIKLATHMTVTVAGRAKKDLDESGRGGSGVPLPRLQVVPLLLCSLCVTRKKTVRKNSQVKSSGSPEGT